MSRCNEGFYFEVTPQKKCCLWPDSPQCRQYKDLGRYCCGHGFHGRPAPISKHDGNLGFNYTPDGERWKKCGKFSNCDGKVMSPEPRCYTPSGVR